VAKIVVRCPSCQGELRATRLSCSSCKTQLEGEFEIPLLLLLSAEDLAFATEFVRASGSLKEVAKRRGVSYPTVRGRLDDVLARLQELEKGVDRKRHKILSDLEHGKLDAKSAAEALRKAGL
jgi:hypothetical protein